MHRRSNYKQQRNRRHGNDHNLEDGPDGGLQPKVGKNEQVSNGDQQVSNGSQQEEYWRKTRGSKSVMEEGQKLKANIIFKIPSLDCGCFLALQSSLPAPELHRVCEDFRDLGFRV